jgi:DDE superfamily endonuclease
MVGLRLFSPGRWTDDPKRMARARVPKNRQTALTKPEIAIEEIDRVIASGTRFGCVLADSGYGSSGPFRQALSERGLLGRWGCHGPKRLSRRRCPIFPATKAGKPRKHHILISHQSLLKCCWPEGNGKGSTGGGNQSRLTCLFAVRRVRVADGHKHKPAIEIRLPVLVH